MLSNETLDYPGLKRLCRVVGGWLLWINLMSCAGQPNYYRPSFVEMARRARSNSQQDATQASTSGSSKKTKEIHPYDDPQAPLHFSDQLALNYADEMIKVLKPKFNRSRMVRNGSDSAQVAASGLVAGTAALKLSTQALSWLGITGVFLPKVQDIFDAKGRSGAYLKAAYEIESAIAEYLSFNQSPSDAVFTQNGVTLVHRTTAAINVVESFLAGQMASAQEMRQMVEPMSQRGAVTTAAGSELLNHVSSSGEMPPSPQPTKVVTQKMPEAELNILIEAGVQKKEADGVRKEIYDAQDKVIDFRPRTFMDDDTHKAPDKYTRNAKGFIEWVDDEQDASKLRTIRDALKAMPHH